jgi:hypothetical protein
VATFLEAVLAPIINGQFDWTHVKLNVPVLLTNACTMAALAFVGQLRKAKHILNLDAPSAPSGTTAGGEAK